MGNSARRYKDFINACAEPLGDGAGSCSGAFDIQFLKMDAAAVPAAPHCPHTRMFKTPVPVVNFNQSFRALIAGSNFGGRAMTRA
jgi:hypothetical protein